MTSCGWLSSARPITVVMASDVIENGTSLELTDLDSAEDRLALVAFWHDDGSGLGFLVNHIGTCRLAAVERSVAAARKRLPPISGDARSSALVRSTRADRRW
jgi:hypothetical protein